MTARSQREIKIYNLDMVLAVGYRVTTRRGPVPGRHLCRT
ncbi:MAG: virulence RhuM family protein [Actinobacteria bacterium]|nr:virulence RhuM family protein [Actinomycetota bacterium]